MLICSKSDGNLNEMTSTIFAISLKVWLIENIPLPPHLPSINYKSKGQNRTLGLRRRHVGFCLFVCFNGHDDIWSQEETESSLKFILREGEHHPSTGKRRLCKSDKVTIVSTQLHIERDHLLPGLLRTALWDVGCFRYTWLANGPSYHVMPHRPWV